MGCGGSVQAESQEARIRELEARNRQLEARNRELEAVEHQEEKEKKGEAQEAASEFVDKEAASESENKEKKDEEEYEETPEDKEEKVKMKKMPPRERTKYILVSGALRLLSAIWLMSQGDGYVINRMQDLPETAFVSPDRAAELFDILYGVIVISYGWMSKKHPDPQGMHMRSVLKYLKKHQASFGYRTGGDFGVFWDYASLPQDQPDGTKKTSQEKRVFDKGLGAINLLYGDDKTLVVQLTNMPKELKLPEEFGTNLTAYNIRGWCFFEATVSGIQKSSMRLLDLGVGKDTLERDDADWDAVQEASTSGRKPPLTPEDMTTALQERKFTNGSDTDLVIKKYKEFFGEVTTTATELIFNNYSTGPGWGDSEIALFAKALPAFTSCKILTLRGHTALTGDGLEQLREKITTLPALDVLYLPKHLKDTPQGKALEADWVGTGKPVVELPSDGSELCWW